MRNSKDILGVILLFIIGFTLLFKNIITSPMHWDENYFISKYWRYKSFFINHNFSRERWALEQEDHPPMIHYMVGFLLDYTGWSSLVDTGEIQPFNADLNKDVKINLKQSNFAIPLIVARAACAFVAILSLIIFYYLLRHRFSFFVSFLSVLLLAINPLFVQISPHVLAESLQGFFLVLSFLVLYMWSLDKNILQKRLIFAGGIGVFSALSYLTKINGILTLIACIGTITVLLLTQRIPLKHAIYSTGVLSVIFFAIVTFFFPPFWYNPITLHLKLAQTRYEISSIQQKQLPHYSIFDVRKYRLLEFKSYDWGGEISGASESLIMIAYRHFWYYDPIRRITMLPLFLILVTCIILKTIFNFRTKKSQKPDTLNIVFITWSLILFILHLFILRLDWMRYYYLLLFPLTILVAYGLENTHSLKIIFKKKSHHLIK